MTPPRVLVVEDEAIIASDISYTLEGFGYHVVGPCGSAAEAIRCAREQVPDAALVDIHLEGAGDGIELARELQGEIGIAVIFLTSHSDEATISRAKEILPYGYLTKPFEERDLHTAIQVALTRRDGDERVRSLERWRAAVMDSLSDAVLVTDSNLRVRYSNPAALETLKTTSVEGSVIYDVLKLRRPEGVPVDVPNLVGTTTRECELAVEGGDLTVEIRVARMPEVDGGGGYVVVITDTSERSRAERALRLSEERFAIAAAGSQDGIWDWNISEGTLHFSDRWWDILGCPEDDRVATVDGWLRRIHSADRDGFELAVDAHLNGDRDVLSHEHRVRHGDGEFRWVRCRGIAVRNERGVPVRIAGSLTDVTESRAVDHLTGLGTGESFEAALETVLEGHRAVPEEGYAMLLVDVDRFQAINETLGYAAGDLVLTSLASRLTFLARDQTFGGPAVTLARFGGDKFAILLAGLRQGSLVIGAAERLVTELCEPVAIQGRTIHVSVCVGIAFSDLRYRAASDVIRDAESAMKHAKREEGTSYRVFNFEMHTDAIERWSLVEELRQAIGNDQLSFALQPIVPLSDGGRPGFEALARWTSPSLGPVGPDRFIPIAEESGLIEELGDKVLRLACRWLATLPATNHRSGPWVSVNVSARQVSGSLVDRVEAILRENRLDPDQLSIEVTESVLLDRSDESSSVITRLRDSGVRVAIDDFGTGYSSLSYLERYRVDCLKIDRSFVTGFVDDRRGQIVGAIIAMAKCLRMRVVAEGVESAEERQKLDELGCDFVQGFGVGKPMPPDDARRWWLACHGSEE